jgi:oxygen-independent coproporphyrinogen III oxidase
MQADRITSLYVHIPFCSKKCDYCAFVTHVGSLKLMDPYLEAVRREAESVAKENPGGPLTTLYFGGGTPSLMSPHQLTGLLAHFDRLFGIDRGCEITLEAHPDTLNPASLREFRSAGVTRISFGGESLDAGELRALGRLHKPEQVINLINQSHEVGFESVNVDLMYGIPQQTLSSWTETLERILRAKPDHLSLYPLSIEPKTVFAKKWRQHLLSIPEEESVASMYRMACEVLANSGYEHYEVANWSLPGRRCRHNLVYWNNQDFYAIGVGAHGYVRRHRTENLGGTMRYIRSWLEGTDSKQVKLYVNMNAEFTETVMLRLRLLREGLDLDEVRRRFDLDMASLFAEDLDELECLGLIRLTKDRLVLEETAVPVANEIWSRFVLGTNL